MGNKLTLVLGGARSGKSAYAQSIIEKSQQPALFVATATAGDEEMVTRIAAHRANRPSHWITLEAPLHVGEAIRSAEVTPWVLLDCVTLLASNVLLSCPEPIEESVYKEKLKLEIEMILATYRTHPGEWYIVSNEVGLGLVPPYELGRYYRDGLGGANQALARAADQVILMVAGIPMTVK
jgi:adenosylcobinamide kinase / adenosylcobinamide-phosphate guanylyltransferase